MPLASGVVADKAHAPHFATRLAGCTGREISLEGRWRPVIALSEGRLRGHILHLDARERVDSTSWRRLDLATLNVVDQERIDLQVAELGLDTLEAATDLVRPPLAFMPVAWSTARAPRSRRKLLKIAGRAQAELRTLPVCEIRGLEPGTPASAVREAAGLLQPIFRGVLARLAPRRGSIALLADCGLTGAAVEAGALAEAADPDAMLRTVLSLQAIGPRVMLHSLRSVAALTAARSAGAAWASLDLVRGGWKDTEAEEALAAFAEEEA